MRKIQYHDHLVDRGINNRFSFIGKNEPENVHITVSGNNNTVVLSEYGGLGHIYISIDGDGCIFRMGKDNTINNDLSINFWSTKTKRCKNATIIIGNENIFNGDNIKVISPLDKKLIIGNGNLFAGNISFWGRNDHILYDKITKKRLNEDRDILLGDNNWICQSVTFLTGARIGSNSVIALGSIVNREFTEKNVMIAGVPAVVKRSNISWSLSSSEENIDYKNPIRLI